MFLILALIAIPIFFFSRWVLKKSFKKKYLRSTFSGIITIILTPLIYLGLIELFIIYISYEPKRSFNKREWISDTLKRYQMRQDILNRHILTNKTTSEVVSLLGNPTFIYDSTKWFYNMGTGTAGFGWQFYSLNITFKDKKVIKIDIGEARD